MSFSSGDKLTTRISRISKSGNAITKLHDSQHINLGQVPKIEGDIPVVITDNSSYLAGEIRLDALDSPLTLTPTEESRRIIPAEDKTVEGDTPNITELNFGVIKLLFPKPIPVDSQATIAFKDLTGTRETAKILSIEDSPHTNTTSESDKSGRQTTTDSRSSLDGTIEDGADIEGLVEQLDKFSSDDSSSATPGGKAREQYACKCCGSRVDPGTHKCDLCKQAGCDAFNKRCRFE